MANQLKMAKVNDIVGLHKKGWSQRKIAQTLGVHRETVAKYLAATTESAAAPTGPEAQNRPQAPPGSESPKPAKAPPESAPSRSDCDPYRERIFELLQRGLKQASIPTGRF